MAKAEFKALTDIEHVLLRPSMYTGSTSLEEANTFIRGQLKELSYVPALVKIVNEVIDNVIDVQIREDLRKISLAITIERDNCKVADTGPGIPVEKEKTTGKLLPELAWTTLRAGTSFVEDRKGPSANGVGASLTCIFSKKFIGETCDGKQYARITSINNCKEVQVFTKKKSGPRGTTVQFWPDFSRFETDCFTDSHIEVIKERLYAIATTFPEISITFNGEKIKPKNFKEFLQTYGESFVEYSQPDYFFGLFPTSWDEYKQYSNINSLDYPDGGTHEEQIMNGLVTSLRELIKKKHRLDMSPAEVKRGFLLVFCGRNFVNLKFSSQSKTSVNNTVAETKAYLDYAKIPFDKLAKKIMATEEIIGPIIASKLAKQAAIEARAVTMAQKKLGQEKVKKHTPANSRIPEERELFICEGDSAAGRLKEVRDTKTQGGYALKGKPLNTYGLSDKEILDNKELKGLMSLTGLKLGMSSEQALEALTYKKGIIFYADADLDGYHIRVLLTNFFSRWPVLFERGIIKILESPIVILEKGRKKEYLYSLSEYKDNLDKWKGWTVRYIKGLGSLRADEYQMVINDEAHKRPVSLDNLEVLGMMFGEDSEARKKFLLGE